MFRGILPQPTVAVIKSNNRFWDGKFGGRLVGVGTVASAIVGGRFCGSGPIITCAGTGLSAATIALCGKRRM